MKKIIVVFLFTAIATFLIFKENIFQKPDTISGAPPYDVGDGNIPQDTDFSWIEDWKRPDGSAKVALQVGHWKNEEVPDELHRLRGNTGAIGGGKTEWEVNFAIAQATAEILQAQGISVELLPATVPHQYFADVFVAIHADGHTDLTKTGFKAAAPRRDYTNKADGLVMNIRKAYEDATGLVWDEETITRNMRGYYAFSWWRYEHAVHPMTVAAIVETGFLTNASDRELIVAQPELSAQGIANGIIEFLQSENLLKS